MKNIVRSKLGRGDKTWLTGKGKMRHEGKLGR